MCSIGCVILSMCLMTPINVSDIQVGVCNVVFWVCFAAPFAQIPKGSGVFLHHPLFSSRTWQ